MSRLIHREDNGNCTIIGMNKENKEEKIYQVADKLREYEETGLSPYEVERLKEKMEEIRCLLKRGF